MPGGIWILFQQQSLSNLQVTANIPSSEAFASQAMAQLMTGAGIQSAESKAIGSVAHNVASVIHSSESLSAGTFTFLTTSTCVVSSDEAIGAPLVSYRMQGAGIESPEALTQQTVTKLITAFISSSDAVGPTALTYFLTGGAISPSETLGSGTVFNFGVLLAMLVNGIATASETVVLSRKFLLSAQPQAALSPLISVHRPFGLLAAAQALVQINLAYRLDITSSNETLTVMSAVDLRLDRISDTTLYTIQTMTGGAAPTMVLNSAPIQNTIATGTNGTIQSTYQINLGSVTVTPGEYIAISSRMQRTTARVVSSPSTGIAVVDTPLPLADPDNGNLSWTLLSAVKGMTLTIEEPTQGDMYVLSVSGLLDVNGNPFSAFARWVANVNGPMVLSAQYLQSTGNVLVTFNNAMLVDSALLSTLVYSISAQPPVSPAPKILEVQTASPTQVLLRTIGLQTANYTLTVQHGPAIISTITIDGPKDTSKNYVSS